MTDEQPKVYPVAISLFSSRTFWLNAIGLAIAVLSMTEVAVLIPPRFLSLYGAGMAALNLVLRWVTVRPVALIAPGATTVVAVPKIAPPDPSTVTD